MAGGDWRDTAIIVWNLDLTVAGEKDVVDDGKIKKKRVVGGGPVVDCWNLDDWEKENKENVILLLFCVCNRPIITGHLELEGTMIHILSSLLKALNWWWNRVFTRFHLILTILPDFNHFRVFRTI